MQIIRATRRVAFCMKGIPVTLKSSPSQVVTFADDCILNNNEAFAILAAVEKNFIKRISY